jgi:dimethylglycine dehydrogenase
MESLPRQAQVVVVGGGIVGCSAAYHLTRMGWTDLVLLEADELATGTTWHSAGLCTQWSPSHNLGLLLQRSVHLYASLEQETGVPTGFRQVGSLRLAGTPERMEELLRVQGITEATGLPLEIVDPDRLVKLFPLINPEGLLGAAHLPTDGYADPAGVTAAFAAGVRARGARIAERTPVRGLEQTGAGWSVVTDRGSIRARMVVNAAGQWARQVGRLAGVDLPIVPLHHQYVVTEPLEELRRTGPEYPVLRDPERMFYVREAEGGLLLATFDHEPRAWVETVPEDFHRRLFEPDEPRARDAMRAAEVRIPALRGAGIARVMHGPDAYTPDGRCLMGPVPGVRNLFVLAGFSIFGVVFGGGAGAYLAEWIVEGQPADNMWELDVARFGEYAASRQYLVERAAEVYRREYAIAWPYEERPAGRPLKTSPAYGRLLEKGAVYGVRSGWERPQWFARRGPAEDRYSFHRSNWHRAVRDECLGVAEGVGVLDQTSFAKFEVSGPGAEAYLDRLCANRLPSRVGRIALTTMCTPRGGVECDLTVTRIGADRFYVISASATESHDFRWLERHLPARGVRLDNVTARIGVLTLAGPRSRELLARLTDANVSGPAFPFFTARDLHVGMAPVRAMRLSYVGELGFELHHHVEYQRYLYDLLEEAGRDLGLVDFGFRALDSMRLEKGYGLWGSDLSADWTPLEAGLDRFVKLEKGQFIGRDALARQQAQGIRRRLSWLVVEADDADAFASEPVFHRDRLIGYVAAGGYGHRVDASIAVSYLPSELAEPGTEAAVEIVGERCPARVVEPPLYDPENLRLRG